MLRFADVVAVSSTVSATRSRLAKVDALAGLLTAADPDEVPAVVAFLAGAPRQGRIGAGWRTLAAVAGQPADSPTLTVRAVDAALGEVAAVSGSGSTARRADLLGGLLTAATADEQRFLRALLTGELRQGALEGVMLDAIARASGQPGPAVRRAFMLSGRLPETAAAALAGTLDDVRLELGRPVRPMLASPGATLADAVADLSPCLVEYKMDGARIQVHKRGADVRVWTRTLREITGSVPELVELVRGLPCAAAVLDGETLALTDDGRPRPFQETMSRFGSTVEEQVRALLLRPYFFDCLHLDGEDLIDEPLRVRTAALRRAVGDHVIPGVAEPTLEQAEELTSAALDAGHEGVMVKDLDSTYQAGRRGKAWQKVKPVHTFDLVVLAAEWGHGRRTGTLSNLHLGARDPDGGPPVMVGKTFKGLTDELLAWQTRTFPEFESHRDDWTVYLRPHLVVEIALDGVQVSPRYPGGIALRFARVVRYRPDKTPAEADTIDTLRGLL
ncbi:ATP-dependent DNA ligase [Actinokineospora sp. UTMC 2448]|uniref:ATP-dependent DNA ligase n=1 Tax=Actinokineospora sp. UTMC 2448 TaxID=2268449 RepID=UPI002164B17C|nr:ATP-dependent DNA ligase [Actinokineospora sp. UTMC 2448]UVS77055.1 Putative DNA ligase-like protein [Actinokineospora sp. UTMC 2448]